MAESRISNKSVILRSRPGAENPPSESNFSLVSRDVPECGEGEILVKTLYLSVDPYMRCRMNKDTGVAYLTPWPLGGLPSGGGVGVVEKSRTESFKAGDILESFLWPWQEFVVFSGRDSSLNKVLFNRCIAYLVTTCSL